LVEKKKNYLRGKVTRFLEEGQGRKTPVCDVAAECGGCSWQHLDYQYQLLWKKRILQETLKRVAHIECHVEDCLPSPDILGYRNKVEVPVTLKGGKIVAGFYKPYSHHVVPSDNCPLEHPLAREVVNVALDEIRRRKISIYNEKTGRGLIRHVVARVAPGTGERMAVVVANGLKIPDEKGFTNVLSSSLKGLKSVVLNINTKNTNVVLGDKERLLWGRPYIRDEFGAKDIGFFKFRISAHSFYQVNSPQAVNLYRIALDAADLNPSDTVFDVYSGIGTITLFAASRAGFAVGVEEVPAAVRDAALNAKENNVENVAFRLGKAERVLPSLAREFRKPSIIIIDPPRGGAEKGALIAMSRMNPRSIVYVSCNPATLARDLITLKEHGWSPKWIQPVDMFPMTPQPGCHLCVPFPEN
jgi:23S rRNA (uracil1939-C5)-methyltransferase